MLKKDANIDSGECVAKFMRRGAITCSEDTCLRDIAQIMVVNQVRYCVIINRAREVKGLLSADGIIKCFGKDLVALRAKDILSDDAIITKTADSPLDEAIGLMNRARTEHLVVLSDRPDSRAVLGILFAGDIISAMANRTEEDEL